jgi:TonB-linked SusC/RagA family outer membrane protein
MRPFSGLRAVWTAALVAAGLVANALPASAQATGTIRGKVTDGTTLRPLSGAQIFVPGSGRGTLSGAAGDYVLLNAPVGSVTLRAEMLGYGAVERTVTVTAGEVAVVDFTMAQSAISLDEIVVTGTPGATQKRAIGNAVTTISAATVTEVAPVSNVTQLLQARSPGLTIMTPTGTVGTAANIRIRGTSSYQAGNAPVFYVDGVRIQSGAQGGYSVNGQQTSALDAINPEDIESIEVIKGPAASTLYGADAAAGVIQIITKKGKPGQQSLQWNAKMEYGQSDWAADMPVNYAECTAARIKDTAGWPGCSGIDPNGSFEQRLISGQPLKDVIRKGTSLNTSLQARGGGDRFSFYVSGDRSNDEGIFNNNFFDRTTGRANFFVTPSDKIDLAVNLSYARSNTRLPLNDNSSYGWLRNAYRAKPGQMGSFAVGWAGHGPDQMNEYDNQTRAERWIIGTTLNYQPMTWFRHRLTAGFDAGVRRASLFYQIDRTGKSPYGTTNAPGAAYQYIPQTRNYTFDYAATLSRPINTDLTSDFSFGMQYNAYRFESVEAWGIGLLANDVRLVSSAANVYGSEGFSETRSLGFFAQEQVGFKNRLFVTGALRMDNSSVFGSEIKRIFYPKLSASYVISDEDFFNVPGVDQLRLRAAWGQAGSSPDPFSADRSWAVSAVALDNGSFQPVLRASAYGNKDLKAERGNEIELGFEASMLENRAGVDVTYYNKTTRDALITVPVPPSSGFTASVLRNLGEINNQGLEVQIWGTPLVTRHMSWESRLGFSTNKNTFVTFNGARTEPILQGYDASQRIAEGYPMGAYWGYRVKRDANGNPVKDAKGEYELADSASYLGSSVPTREASLANTFTVLKNLRLYVFADYKGGHYLYNMTARTRDFSDNNSYYAVTTPAEEKKLKQAELVPNYVEHADFVKLREVSLSYNLPRSLSGKIGLKDMSVSVAGRNLGMWTKYSGPDPEVNIEGNATFTRGDYMSVPSLRRFVTTVNVRF